jgi:hypothetical protein
MARGLITLKVSNEQVSDESWISGLDCGRWIGRDGMGGMMELSIGIMDMLDL